MKITVWTVATDDDYGTNVRVFKTEDEAIDYMLSWAGTNREEWAASEHADDLYEYIRTLTGWLDTITHNRHRLEIDPACLKEVTQ